MLASTLPPPSYLFCLTNLLLAAIILLQTTLSIYQAVTSPLRSIPGPFLARFTRRWYAYRVSLGSMDIEIPTLHQRYGPVIRIAPDWYVLSSPAVLRPIYGFQTSFVKSAWYFGWEAPGKGGNLFATRDPRDHAARRRKVQSLYSLSSLVGYEGCVEECLDVLVGRLPRGQVLDLGHWLQCFAFDVVASITFGGRFGFLDEGRDVGVAMAQLERMGMYSTLMGVFHEWHAALYPVASRLAWTGARGREFVRDFVIKRVSERAALRSRQHSSKDAVKGEEKSNTTKQDFLDRMFDAHEGDPQKIDTSLIHAVGISNVNAGSDTTAGTLSGILYELLQNKQVLTKLRQELAPHIDNKQRINFKTAFELPYLSAVVREGMRLHPVIGLPLWRVVPAGGAELGGHFFPAGSVVGVQAMALHRDPAIFPSPDEFRPERWIESSAEELKAMDAAWMAFGLGSRVCIGRHVSELEIFKLVPLLVMRFDMRLEGSAKQGFRTRNNWFVKPVDFRVVVEERGDKEGSTG